MEFRGVLDRTRAWLTEDRKRAYKILVIVVILVIAIGLRLGTNAASVRVEDQPESEVTAYVDISGAVNKPGIYSVAGGTRLYEVIDLAGGLAENADIDLINQAEFIEDGQKILIPFKTVEGDNEQDLAASGMRGDANGRISINTASKEELKKLNGIGDALADRIIEYRSSTRFRTIEDIKNVKGIGDSVFDKIKDSISL
ncbi:MAG: helix-hairpin-helix domain-containing protein [Bacillota bacterium]|nr:helix-hairpin-helix domain-containing protein [Bacillota bacterium]